MVLFLYFKVPQARALSGAYFQKFHSVELGMYQTWSCERNCFFLSLSARGFAHSRLWKQLCTEENENGTRNTQHANTEIKVGKNVQSLKGI